MFALQFSRKICNIHKASSFVKQFQNILKLNHVLIYIDWYHNVCMAITVSVT